MKKIGLFGLFTLSFTLVASAIEYISPEAMATSPDGKTLYTIGATSKQIVLVDAASVKKVGAWKTELNPSGVVVAKDGSVYVTAGGQDGMIYHFSATGTLLKGNKIGHTPMSPVLSPDGKSLFVACRFDTAVAMLDAQSLAVQKVFRVTREPHAMAMGANGKLLFVANHLPLCRATDDVVAAVVSVIDLATGKVTPVSLPNGSTGVRGMCASPDGKSIYVTHTVGRYQLPTTQLERGWMNTAGMSVLNGETGAYINTVLLDDVDLGAANPWGVCVSADGKSIAVAHSGTKEVSIIDRIAMENQLAKAAKNERVTEVTHHASDVPNDLSFLANIRKRYTFDGIGPRGVVILGNRVYTSLYFSDAIGTITMNSAAAKSSISLLGAPVDLSKDRTRRGEMLWNDATMCFQQWQSCASCHPDGRADALNWDLLNDGMGNPKQSKNLVYCHLTPPAMVTGIRPGMKACNRKGITYIQFVVRPEEDGLCLDEYVMSLKPTPSPETHISTGFFSRQVLSEAAKRGEKLFETAGCATCHPASKKGPNGESLFTDLKKYDMGLGVDSEAKKKFDTPTLVECWRTAPYLYDGRALTIEEVLTTCNPHDTHGKTKNLTPAQIKDLAAYVRSL